MGFGHLALALVLSAAEPAPHSPPSRPVAAPAAPETDLAAFGRLRAEGVAAYRAGDLPTAAARLAEAERHLPNHPGVMRLRSRIAAARGDLPEALAQLDRYARAGLTLDVAAEPVLAAAADTPGHAEVLARLQANTAPVGADRLSVVAAVPGSGLVESLVRDTSRGRWLVSRVAGRDIQALDDTGRLTAFLTPSPAIEGVFGLALDASAALIWAATNPAPPAAHGRETPGPAAVLAIDARTGEVRSTVPLPPSERPRGVGDILRTRDGRLYVSDGLTGEVFDLDPTSGALGLFIAPGVLGSPQGLIETPDGRNLIIADYSSGLWLVPRSGEAPRRLVAPDTAVLIGIDGLITDGTAVYTLQNGVAPQRVLKLVLDETWTRIDRVEVLAANLPELDEPTTGVIFENDLVFVARSQWSDFESDGKLKTQEPAAALVARLRLN
ncbi:hypothetical protein ACO2Q1_15475 [Brevundimonas sp. VNH65]|uniref:hypothetical protein n=1 Tax=Brevundimonas sp. VNH65 TaxID=3400917 RepID=UPI003BFE3227